MATYIVSLAWREGFSMEGARALGKVCVVNLVHLLDSRHVCERVHFASAGWLLVFPRLQVGGAATRVRVSQAWRRVQSMLGVPTNLLIALNSSRPALHARWRRW